MGWCFVGFVLILAVLAIFLVAPGRPRRSLRAPFLHYHFAHRGLFTRDQSVPENSLPAFSAAVACGCGIELSGAELGKLKDGEPFVTCPTCGRLVYKPQQ